MNPDHGAAPPSAPPAFRQALTDVQDRVAAAFGIRPADRVATVRGMLERSSREAPGYWLQLLLAMGIASLGLVLGSTAVVIGAMLISPLMGPIVELGMGLAIGSPFLVLRAFTRTAVSVLAVVASAALLTSALPFNEITPEIAARTSPTALDLVIATFCAIAAAYAAVKPGSDTASTSAGTAIGIALVPPLCVVGYGFGARSMSIASGAALLFTANFCAIVLFAVLCFLLLGYGSVRAAGLEHEELTKQNGGAIWKMARGLDYVFGSRYGGLLRVMMPLALLGAVYLPLQHALTEVSWQVRVRAAIEKMIGELPHGAVRSSITVERQNVAVRLVTLGRAEEEATIERALSERIAAAAGVTPRVEVLVVPDAVALQEVAASVRAAALPIEVVRKAPGLDLLRGQLGKALEGAWPEQAGPLIERRIRLPEGKPMVLEVVHVGGELGAAGAALLGRAMSRELGADIVIRDVAVSPAPITAAPEEGIGWLPKAQRALDRLEEAEGLHACVEVPAAVEEAKGSGKGAAREQAKAREQPAAREQAKGAAREIAAVTAAIRASQAERPDRVVIREGARWEVTLSTAACAKAEEAPATGDGGAAAGGAADGGGGR